MPPDVGPSTRDRLNCVELSAIAFGRSRRGTSVGSIDWYAGPPKACPQPEMKDSAKMYQTLTWCVRISAVSVKAENICTYCEPVSSRRLSCRSAMTPPISMNSSTGNCAWNVSSPR